MAHKNTYLLKPFRFGRNNNIIKYQMPGMHSFFFDLLLLFIHITVLITNWQWYIRNEV